MKDSRPKIDGNLIDDLVSGQVTGERYRAALQALDGEPAKWRDCALAFLEEQALRSELRALVQGDINWSGDSSPQVNANGSVTPISLTNSIPSLRTGERQDEQLARVSQRSSIHFWSMLSTAALVLISFTVGWLGSEVSAEREHSASSESATNLLVQRPPKAASAVSSQMVPQYVVDHGSSFDRRIPRSLRELARNGKISVESFDVLMPATLEDGSAAVIPVQELRLGRGTLVSY